MDDDGDELLEMLMKIGDLRRQTWPAVPCLAVDTHNMDGRSDHLLCVLDLGHEGVHCNTRFSWPNHEPGTGPRSVPRERLEEEMGW